jgi:hypothetical protein
MLTYLRYALATFCFAASVGCLGLWGLSHIDVFNPRDWVTCELPLSTDKVKFEAYRGVAVIGRIPNSANRSGLLLYFSNIADEKRVERLGFPYDSDLKMGRFGIVSPFCYFPLWHPTLIFGLAGMAVLRFPRRFSIRSALSTITVVATLIGLAVIL